jgi:hypothetical protein
LENTCRSRKSSVSLSLVCTMLLAFSYILFIILIISKGIL